MIVSRHPRRLSKRTLLAEALYRTGCGRVIRSAKSWRGVLALNYHRVGNPSHSLLDRQLWSATTEEFDAQVRAVVRDFDVISVDDLETALQDPRGRYVMITFDDGYIDNYTEAFPILKHYRAAGTFFISTGFLDVPQIPWWDAIAWMVNHARHDVVGPCRWFAEPIRLDHPQREESIRPLLNVYKRLTGPDPAAFLSELPELLGTTAPPPEIAHELWMTWPMLREMRQCGMTIGGHTVNHPILANLSADAQDFEIGECRRRLLHEIGGPIKAFSYPVGGQGSFNQVTKATLARHGFDWGFTYLAGTIQSPVVDRYALPRAAIEMDIDRPLFHAILTLPKLFG